MRRAIWLALVTAAACAVTTNAWADIIHSGDTSLSLSFSGNTATLTIDSPIDLTLINVNGSDSEGNAYPISLSNGGVLPSDGSAQTFFGSDPNFLSYALDSFNDSEITFQLFDLGQSCNQCILDVAFHNPNTDIPFDFQVDPAISAVPEPGSLALLSTGLIFVARRLRTGK